MNENLKFLLSMIIMYLRSTLKSPKALKALVAIAPYLIEARDLLDQIVATIPLPAFKSARKSLKSGKTFALKLES